MKLILHPIRRSLVLFVLALTLATAVSAQDCEGRRPDIEDFSAQEQLELRNHIIAYLATGFNPNIPLTGMQSFADRNPIVGLHSAFLNTQGNMGNWHSNNEEFFSWHRGYIHGLESYLEEQGAFQFVPLPGYNPINPVPAAFTGLNSLVPDLSSVGNFSGNFAFPNLDFRTYNGVNSFIQNSSECGSLTIDQFAGINRTNAHNSTHVRLGDAMGGGITASGAAIFWLFHAYVDEAYFCFQSLCEGKTSDLWVSDADGVTTIDDGSEPSGIEEFWKSEDIFPAGGWVDGTSVIQQNNGQSVTIAVRVRNRGQLPNPEDVGRIRLYWAAASPGLNFPQSFDGSLSIPGCPGRPLGGLIGVENLRSINEAYPDVFDVDNNGNTTEVFHDNTTYEFEWTPPDPDNYIECFGSGWEHRHFCLLAVIEEGGLGTAPTQIGNDMAAFVRNNNVVALRNIALYGNGIVEGIAPQNDCFVVGNARQREKQKMSLRVELPNREAERLFAYTKTEIGINKELEYKWVAGGKQTTGIIRTSRQDREIGRTYFDLNGKAGGLENMVLLGGELAELCLSMELLPGAIRHIDPRSKFQININQYDDGKLVGGETVDIHMRYLIEQQRKLDHNRRINGGTAPRLLGPGEPASSKDQPVEVFPNPSSGSFVVRLPDFESDYELTLSTLLGQRVWGGLASQTSLINVATTALPAGTYVLSVVNSATGTVEIKKVIIR